MRSKLAQKGICAAFAAMTLCVVPCYWVVLDGIAISGKPLEPSAYPVTVRQVEDTLLLKWPRFGDGQYTVQGKDESGSGVWSTAPGTRWPVTTTSWKDAGILASEVTQRFYRVTSGTGDSTLQVGFVKVPAVKNGLTMISVPLIATDKRLNGSEGCLGDMIKQFLSGGPCAAAADVIWTWDPGSQTYARSAFLVGGTGLPEYDGKWFDASAGKLSDLSLDAGDCFWLQRRNKGPDNVRVTFLGSVPWVPTITLEFVSGFTMFGWPYPTTLALNESTLGTDGFGGPSEAAADVVWQWDARTQTYAKRAFLVAGWDPAHNGKWWDPDRGEFSDISFTPGVAMWYERKIGAPAVWVCVRPYDL